MEIDPCSCHESGFFVDLQFKGIVSIFLFTRVLYIRFTFTKLISDRSNAVYVMSFLALSDFHTLSFDSQPQLSIPFFFSSFFLNKQYNIEKFFLNLKFSVNTFASI